MNHQKEERYVDWQEGAEILGVNRSTFFYHVARGEIATLEGTPPKQGRYKESDILAVKERRKSRRPRKEYTHKEEFIVDWSRTFAEVSAGITLAEKMYHEEIPIEQATKYLSWRMNNDKIAMAAFSPNRTVCYAAIQVLPLPEHIILDILSGKRPEGDIKPEEILSYEQPGSYNLLVTNVVVTPDRRYLIYSVIEKYMRFWIDEMYPGKYIRRVYAQAISQEGTRLAEYFFMSPRYDLADNAFELDFAKRPVVSKFVRQKFIDELRKKASLPPDLYQYE